VNNKTTLLKRMTLPVAALALMVTAIAVVQTKGQEDSKGGDRGCE